MDNKFKEINDTDINRELQEKIFNDLKVSSLAIVRSIDVYGYNCELIPQLNNSPVKIKTINKLYENYYSHGDWKDPINGGALNNLQKDKNLSDGRDINWHFRLYEDIVDVGDIIVVLFLDSKSSNKPNKKNNVDDDLSKHSYDNAVAILKIWDDAQLKERINIKKNKPIY